MLLGPPTLLALRRGGLDGAGFGRRCREHIPELLPGMPPRRRFLGFASPPHAALLPLMAPRFVVETRVIV